MKDPKSKLHENLKAKKVTLYFTEGSRLSEKDIDAINTIPGGAFHRNASLIGPDDKLEECDAVAGPAIPQAYIEAGKKIVEGINDGSEETFGKPEDMSVADLKLALVNGKVDFPAGAKKADLVALYRENFEVGDEEETE